LDLRKAVFIDEQGFPEDLDAYDDIALHLLAKSGEKPVGAARIVIDEDVAKIGRICVLPEMRGSGLGAAIVQAAMDVARDMPGVTTAQLSAQVRAMGFYENLGFAATGPEYDDFGVPHQSMVRPL
jgi:ElaA protein